MATHNFSHQRPHELLAVFRDEATATRVVDAIKRRTRSTSRKGDHVDEQHALNAEMSDQMESALIAPQAGIVYTKESLKTGLVMMPAGIVIGTLVALPLVFLGDMTMLGRLALALGVGGGFGFTVAIVLMSLGARRPTEMLAAERGVVVRVKEDTPQIRKMLLAERPLRVDVVDDLGEPIEHIAATKDDDDPEEIGRRVNEWP